MKIEISENMLQDLKKSIESNKPKEIVFEFTEKNQTNLGENAKNLRVAIDECILQNINTTVENVPYCFLVGYKRYIKKLQNSKKTKLAKCRECAHFNECSGIWIEYINAGRGKEIQPVNGNMLVTDNERCMIEILLREEKTTTKKLLELKNSIEFKDICAHCVGSDDVMLTGKNLVKKGIVKREFTSEGYIWSLSKENAITTGKGKK